MEVDETIAQILINLAIKDGTYEKGKSLKAIQKKLRKKRGQGHKQKYTYPETNENQGN